jgi:cell wall-associated NlpC family hydrolase
VSRTALALRTSRYTLLAILIGAGSSAACATSGAVPRPFPGASAAPAAPAAATAVLETALGLRGVPYRNGGSDPAGFDCSGFTQWVFAQHGLVLPREVRDQFREGVSVGRRQIARGDLLFFSTTSQGASHVAIAMGDGSFVHAPSSSGVVRVERLDIRYWDQRFVGARRIL